MTRKKKICWRAMLQGIGTAVVCWLAAIVLGGLPGAGCSYLETGPEQGQGEGQVRKNEESLEIVTTISIFADLAENVAGAGGSVSYLVPRGENPEDYELLPGQVQKLTEADLVLVNGWGLEEKIEQALDNVAEGRVFYLTRGLEPIPLTGEQGKDPHAWLNPNHAARYVENIAAALVEVDPEREAIYRENSGAYLEKLQELDSWTREQLQTVPEDARYLIISENALKYFGEAYAFQTEGIWELNAHEEGTPQQIQRIVDLVAEKEIPALFVESTVDRRYMKTISRETGVPIAGLVYTDALGNPGNGAETYLEMIRYNVEMFREGLGR